MIESCVNETPISSAPSSDLYYKWNGLHNKSILLVHVGKTAGASVKAQFETDGLDFEQVHLHSVDEAMIRAHAVVLVSLRDPVQRLVSAFNFRSPAAGVPLDPVCPLEQHKPFYDCFKSLDEYANALTDQSACGRIARRGECHTEFDTCAYLGGVMQELERNRHKVFVLDKATVLADLNRISNHLRWKIKFNKLPRIHEYSKSPNMTQISIVGMMKLTGFLAATGETAIYQKLSTDFRLPP